MAYSTRDRDNSIEPETQAMTYPSNLSATPFLPCYPPGVVAWIDVFGCAVPFTWGDVAAEYHAIREHAAIMDFSMLFKFDVEGHGALDAVNRVFSRDLTKIAPGRIAYGVIVTDDGRMVDDCTAFVHNSKFVRIISAAEKVGDFLKAHAPPSISVTERRSELAHLVLQGPKSRSLLQQLTKVDLSNAALPYYSFRLDIALAGLHAEISRMGFTGELGYEIIVPARKAAQLWSALQEVGRREGLLPFGQTAIMIARIEAGLIIGGLDYTHDTTPYECRMGWAVDLEKRSFQGKEALLRLKDSARTNVVSVVLSSTEREFSGCHLLCNGEDIGIVPMVVSSPYLGNKLIAMATVSAENASVGTRFSIDGYPHVVAEIVSMPIYDPSRTRARA